MKSPRQGRNEARRARHRAAAETASFEGAQDVARRTREASDAARLARLEVQGRGYRPIFAQAPIVFGAPVAPVAEALLGGGNADEDRRPGLVKESRSRSLGGGA